MIATVCGGAQCLVSDIKKCPIDTIKVSANHHAANMLGCEYVVYFHDVVKSLVKYLPTTLVDVKTNNIKVYGYVGTSAVQFALNELKADKVYLAGFDLYQTMYCHEYSGKPGGARHPSNVHIEIWREFLTSIGDKINRLIPISGPLKELCYGLQEER